MNVPIENIKPNPTQPRQNFDQNTLNELAKSIKQHGIIQPIVVEPNGDGYIIHDGERRWRAAQIAGLTEVPVSITDQASEQDKLIRAVVANEQRDDLNPVEKARGYQRLHDEFALSDQQIAEKLQKSRSVIANARRLLNLPELHLTALSTGEISERQAMAVLPLFTLPEPIKKRLEGKIDIQNLIDSPWHISHLSSEHIRRTIDGVHGDIARPFKNEFPQNETIPGTKDCKIIQPLCNGCPYLYKNHCYYNTCYIQKIYFWKQQQLVPVKEALKTGLWKFADDFGSFVCISCGKDHQIGTGPSYGPQNYTVWYDAKSIPATTEENLDKPLRFERIICTDCHPAPTKSKPLQPQYIPIWQLEASIRNWLSNAKDRQAILTEIKERTETGIDLLNDLLTGDILPGPKQARRAGDVRQACNNVLEQYRQEQGRSQEVPIHHPPQNQVISDEDDGTDVKSVTPFQIQSRFSLIIGQAKPDQLPGIYTWLDNLEKYLFSNVCAQTEPNPPAPQQQSDPTDPDTGEIEKKLAELKTYLERTTDHTPKKLINRGMVASDLWGDVNNLIRDHGETDHLSTLLAELEAIEAAYMTARRKLGITQE